MKTIRQLRQERGWTQYELAVKVGVHPQAVYLWERRRRTPQVPQMRKLGELFGLCSDEIDLGSAPNSSDADAQGQAQPTRPDRRDGGMAPGARSDGHR